MQKTPKKLVLNVLNCAILLKFTWKKCVWMNFLNNNYKYSKHQLHSQTHKGYDIHCKTVMVYEL